MRAVDNDKLSTGGYDFRNGDAVLWDVEGQYSSVS